MGSTNLFKKDAQGVCLISPSQINTLMTCGAKWRFKVVDKMKDPAGIDSKIGNFVHDTLEALAKRKMAGEPTDRKLANQLAYEAAIQYFTDPVAVKELRGEEPLDALTNGDAYSRMCGNLAEVAWDWFLNSGLKIVSCERTVDWLLDYQGNPIKVGGRLDILAEDKDGRIIIIDWKTAGKAPSKSPRGGYVMDRSHANQQLIYARCLKEVGIDVKAVGTLKVTKTKTPGAYYASVDVTDGMLAWSETIVRAAIRMVFDDALPPNPMGAGPLCAAKYCFAYDVCPGSSKHIGQGEAHDY